MVGNVGSVELQLSEIWKEALGTQDIHLDSNFFEAGGDSLQMMTMLFRVGEVFGVEVHPGVLFERPTLSALADHIYSLQLPLANREVAETGML